MKKINVAIVGVGSFTKALVEGVAYYTHNPQEIRGLMHPTIGPYRVQDINFVAAFDVDERKVGKPLHEAISAGSNVTLSVDKSLRYKALVYRGPTLDGVIEEMKGTFVRESDAPVADIAAILRSTKTDVVVNLVPTGSELATQAYAEAALSAGCSYINCIPTPLATIPKWIKKFEDRGLVLLGDDIKSQLGATMLNRFLLSLLKMRGIHVIKSEQENRGANADHYNLLFRAKAKERSKKEALTQLIVNEKAELSVKFFYSGEPSGHKRVNIGIEAEIFGRVPITINSVIEDEISFNGAGILVDAIRVAQHLVDKGMVKQAHRACPFLMKAPPHPMSDIKASAEFTKIIKAT